jgi:hypothetical protein
MQTHQISWLNGNASRKKLWSEFLATDPEARVRFPALRERKK